MCCEKHIRALQTFKTKQTSKRKASHYNLESQELSPCQVNNTVYNLQRKQQLLNKNLKNNLKKKSQTTRAPCKVAMKRDMSGESGDSPRWKTEDFRTLRVLKKAAA